jgi:CTP synthase
MFPKLCKYAAAGDKIFSSHNDSGILDAGDIESMPFIEALGQFSYRVGEKTTKSCLYVYYGLGLVSVNIFPTSFYVVGPGNFCLVHVSLVPVLNVVGEQVSSAYLKQRDISNI